MHELAIIFFTGFVSVFALGFQSRNVNHGNYLWAALTSLFVGCSSATLWTHIMAHEMGLLGGVVYGVAGSLAITSSMFVHERFINGRVQRLTRL